MRPNGRALYDGHGPGVAQTQLHCAVVRIGAAVSGRGVTRPVLLWHVLDNGHSIGEATDVDRCGMAAYLREAEPHLPIKWVHMSKRLPDRCVDAEIDPITPNDLRRTVATPLIESGVDAYTVAKITRHATLGMLKQVYDRSNTAATRELIDGPARRRTGTKTVQKTKKKPGAVRASK